MQLPPGVVWATDLHLDHCAPEVVNAFLATLEASDATVLILTGDIGQASTTRGYLHRIVQSFRGRVCFVLGNHDAYGASIHQARSDAEEASRAEPRLVWLTSEAGIPLSDDTVLIGHDGWADGRAGDFESSPGVMQDIPLARDVLVSVRTTAELRAALRAAVERVRTARLPVLNDYRLIEELTGLTADARRQALAMLGDKATEAIAAKLADIPVVIRHVVIATHVPPFREAAWYDGRASSPAWAPHFVCQALGERLLAIAADWAQSFAERTITVLCGHTHGSGIYTPAPNLTVLTGGAVYGSPALQAPAEP